MNNFSSGKKRLKLAHERSWASLDEQSKNKLVQIIEFKDEDNESKKPQTTTAEVSPNQIPTYHQRQFIDKNHQSHLKSSKTYEQNSTKITSSSNSNNLKTTSDVASLKKSSETESMRSPLEVDGSLKKKPLI